jgi:hypothetical protein
MRKIMCSQHEGARDLARAIAATDAYSCHIASEKKVEMLFAHLKRILKLERLRAGIGWDLNTPRNVCVGV